MNTEKIGSILAEITNKNKKKESKIIYNEFDESKVKNYICDIKLDSNEIIQQIPNKNAERDVLYITGASGAGKSYYCKNYLLQYNKAYPTRPIYIFSSLTEDETLDNAKIKNFKRIKLNQEFLNLDLTLSDFKDCCIFFDDCDNISNKHLKSKIFNILNTLLQTARHSNTTVIVTSHLPTNGLETKIILAEAKSITIFPSTLGSRSIKYLLDNYLGLDRNEIKFIKKLKTRWFTIFRTSPLIGMSESGIYCIADGV